MNLLIEMTVDMVYFFQTKMYRMERKDEWRQNLNFLQKISCVVS